MSAIQQMLLASSGSAPIGNSDIIFDSTRKRAEVTLSNADLTASTASIGAHYGAKTTGPKSSGKWQFEITINARATTTANVAVGVMEQAEAFTTISPATTNGFCFWTPAGTGMTTNRVYDGGTFGGVNVVGPMQGDVVTVTVDFDNKAVNYYKNGVLQGSDATISALDLTGGKVYVPFVDLWGGPSGAATTVSINHVLVHPVAGFAAWTA